ncbi:MAG: SDR family NAD(P)-dependent oxidoreductase [Prevotella sp.]|nr:SDR family NAD(P)-dependent oxidoreductase [Prevotella sp.]
MKKQQEYRRAIVIGASSGIGQRLARLLLHDGWHLGVAARREEPLEQLAKDFPEQVVWSRIDVTDAQAADQLEQLVKKAGGMDLFLYTSGVGKMNPDLDPEPEDVTLCTNALGFTRMVGAAYRYFARQGRGHIAVITSIAGVRGLGPSPSYSATKALQSTYLEALEQQSHARGLNIRFTDIRPGFIDTPLLHGDRFPHTLSADEASRSILKAIYSNRHVAYIDSLWHAVVLMMRLTPRVLWRRMNLNRV